MIAVAVSAFLALYILGPDAFSRVVLGFTVPRRNVLLTRSEEITRALVWSLSSFFVAYLWCRADGTWSRVWQPAALRTCFAGLYSEEFFRTHQDLWFSSLHPLFALNLNLLGRLYATVLVFSVVLSVLTHYYGVIRDRLPLWAWLRGVFAAVVLPRVAPWHTLLSKLLLGDRDLLLIADILTKSDKLYQGELTDKLLAADGSLVSLTLAEPRRFDRPSYLNAKDSLPKPSSQDFWKPIPTNLFLVMASDINTINLRYVPRDRRMSPLQSGSPELQLLLKTIAEQVDAARRQAETDRIAKEP